MIDNLDRFLQFADFSDPDKFYLIQVLQRKKDIPTLDKSTRLLKTYTVTSADYLLKIQGEIEQLCQLFQARAYVYVNRRSYKNTARHMMKTLADNFMSDSFVGITHLFTSEAAAHGIGDKLWILDLDLSDANGKKLDLGTDFYADDAEFFLGWFRRHLEPVQPQGDKVIGWLPTKHGFHYLVDPFDTRELTTIQKELATDYRIEGADYQWGTWQLELELKKDAMTNLYIP